MFSTIESVHAALGELLERPPHVGEDRDAARVRLIREVRAIEQQAAALRLRAVEQYRRAEDWREPGATSCANALIEEFTLDPTEARAWVRTGEFIAARPSVEEALGDGRVSADHAAVIASGQDVFRAIDDADGLIDSLVRACGNRTPREMSTKVRSLRDAVLDRRPDTYERRRLFQNPDGDMGTLNGKLDGEVDELLRLALEAMMESDPDRPDEKRTMAQRRHDALGLMARRVLADPAIPKRRGVRPRLNVRIDLDDLFGPHCDAMTDHGLRLSSDTLERLACDCDVARVMFSNEKVDIDMGRDARVAPDKLFRALAARDQGCRCCRAPVSDCEAHHVVTWTAEGGTTDPANLVLLCWRCHRLFHEGGWRMKLGPDGTICPINPRGEHLEPRPPPGRDQAVAA